MTHLTLTGFHAGQTLCGAPRSSGAMMHAAYCDLDKHGDICPACAKILREVDTDLEADIAEDQDATPYDRLMRS